MKKYHTQEIINLGKETISKEIDALKLLVSHIDDSFAEIVQLVANNKGRLIISGVGKSALVGTKIVATLNSTGTPAIFMHAADAAHGDLGMIQDGDIILCISKSGETEEITFMLQMIKKFGNPIISMTSNKKSSIALLSDYLLYTPITEEADPNNLAPTSSSTVQMAIGDALAISLSTINGFTAKHFARFHPGGALGKQLYLKVSDIINQNLTPSVTEKDNLRTIILEMTTKRLGATAVIDRSDKVIGIITDGDLRRMLNQHENTKHITATDIMSPNPKHIAIDTLAVDALKIMRTNSITQLIVQQENKYVGMIHIYDILSKGL